MKIRNLLIAMVIIASLLCVMPTLIDRLDFESSHNGYEVGLVFTPDMTMAELEKFKQNGIHTLIFDEKNSKLSYEAIGLSKDLGFDAAIRVHVGDKKDENFEKNFDAVVRENGIKYVIISENKKVSTFDAPLENVIEKNNMTLVVSENTNQLSNKMPKGYESYLASSNGKVMRSYETLKNPLRTLNSQLELKDAGELLYHHMINSVRDRNTEFIVLNLIDDGSGDRETAIDETIFAVKKFMKSAERLGYEKNKDISLKGYMAPPRIVYMASVLLLGIMALASLEMLVRKRNAVFEWIFLVLSFGAFCFVGVLPESLTILIPTLFAPLSACFAFSVTIGLAYYAREKAFSAFKSVIIVFSSALISLSLGSVCLGAMLSGTDFYLNNLIFRGVKLSLIFPLAYAALWMWLFEGIKIDLSQKSLKAFFSKIKLWHIIVFALALFAAGVYVMRSGNAKISPLENAIRNFISDVSGARPRTKEFLIGWPILAFSVILIKNSSSKILRWAACVGSSVLFASVTNTFCHVFTDFSVSALRTVNGLLFSLPFVIVAVFLARLFKSKTK